MKSNLTLSKTVKFLCNPHIRVKPANLLFPSPFSLFFSTVSRFYEIGCFANKNKVINELKPQGSQSQSNEPAVLKCAKLAQDKSYHFFAVGHSGTCYSGPYPGRRYFKYGSILYCKKGNKRGFFVYSFGKFVLIIFELDLKLCLFIKTDNMSFRPTIWLRKVNNHR